MKIGALIPIRLASERLPGKALKDVCGRPVVHHLLDRVVASRHIGNPRDVVVCTTTEASDDPLVPVVEGYGCSIFRGSVDDLIRRFADAIERFGFDAVIQADGDDPLSATEYMDLTMQRLLADRSLDIVTARGLPLGIATKSFTRAAVKKVLASYKTERNDTGFIYFFTKSGICKHAEIDPVAPEHVQNEARITLDYDVDLATFRRIFEALYRPGKVFNLAELVRYLNGHPEVVAMNLNISDEYWQRTAQKLHLEYVGPDGKLAAIKG